MSRTRATMGMALLAVVLGMLWTVEHEYTAIRAPWTGLTYAAMVLAFIGVGVVGRGWRAVAVATAVAAAPGLGELLVSNDVASEPGVDESCDPGCISPEAAVVMVGAAAAVLATVGIVLRRAVGLARCRSVRLARGRAWR